MASGIFAVLDDIAVLMDDVVTMSKVATKKTAGILGDDLAVNAEKATGFVASRELPVLWEITKGSFINKLIILPIVFLLSYFFPFVIQVVLIIGGLYLAYEGVLKVYEYLFMAKIDESKVDKSILITENEKEKIKSAVTTDFILSLEIVIIALGTVIDKSLEIQIATVTFVALLATIGVYGIVALIVRMDDFGLYLIKISRKNSFLLLLGNSFIRLLPLVIRFLSVVGTVALLLVAGGIFAHNIPYFHHFLPHLPSMLSEFLLGIMGGLFVFIPLSIFSSLYINYFSRHKS